MTQDGFAAAERITATLDALATALLDARATHYPAATLAAFRQGGHPSADALFGLRLSPGGPGLLTLHGVGTVLESAATRRTDQPAAAEAVRAVLARFDGGPVRGLPDAPSAAALQLPVSPEPAAEKLRPPFAPPLAALASARETRSPEELSTGSGVEARLMVPSVFHPLTVRGAGAALAAHLSEVTEELFAGARAARRDWAAVTAALADEITAAGVVYAGVTALKVGDRPTHASLVVSVATRPLPVQELALALSTERPHAEVWTVLLPAGPAALLVEARTAPVPAMLAADGQRGWVVSSVVEAFIPLPDGATVLTVQLSTTHAEDWDLYAGAFAELLESIQLAWDGVTAAPAPTGYAQPAAAAAPAAPQVPQAPAQPTPAAAPTPASAPTPAPAPVAAVPPVPPMPPAPPAVPPTPVVPVAAAAPAAPATEPATDATERPKGTPVRVPPADFNPFAVQAPTTQTASAAPAAQAAADPFAADPFGTPAADPFGTPAADPFGTPAADPFGTPSAPNTPVAAAVPAQAAGGDAPKKGTPVRVPPADFNPFAPPAPAPAAPAAPAADTDPAERPKGTPVRVPPADFNPFGAQAPVPAQAAPPAAPSAPPVAAPAPQPSSADPFGTVVSAEPKDPFGTVTTGTTASAPAAVPPPPTAPPTIPAAAGDASKKATPVRVPPADFNPFAPPAPAPAAPAADTDPAERPKGTPVRVPPADFNPFAAQASPAAPAAPPAAPAPATDNNPFG